MKLIIAIIQPHKLDSVKEALEDVDVNLMTVTNVLGQGRQKGHTEIYRGAKEAGGLLNKVRLDIAVMKILWSRLLKQLPKELIPVMVVMARYLS